MFSRSTKKRQSEPRKNKGSHINYNTDENDHLKVVGHQPKRSSFTQMLKPSRTKSVNQNIFHSKGKSVYPINTSLTHSEDFPEKGAMEMEVDDPSLAKRKWKTAVDPKSGKTYYYDMISRKSTWDKPFELCTPDEQREMKAKERKIKSFFREMESNILNSLANGNLPGGFHPIDGKSYRTAVTLVTSTATTSPNMCCARVTHMRQSSNNSFGTISPTLKPRPSQLSPDQVTSLSSHKYHPESMAENEFLDEGIEMMEDENGKLFPSHVRRLNESKPYSASAELGRDVTIKCICIAYRAHMIESTIRYYEGTLDCSETFNDTRSDDTVFKMSHSSPLAHPRIRETISRETDILDLASHYRGPDVPSIELLMKFFTEIFQKSQMEPDCIIMALIYVERIMKKTHDWVRPTSLNWRCILLLCIMMSSKVWDDLSMINADFANICASMRVQINLQRINDLELSILHRLKYRVTVTTSEYTKYNIFIRSVMATRGRGLECNDAPSRRQYGNSSSDDAVILLREDNMSM